MNCVNIHSKYNISVIILLVTVLQLLFAYMRGKLGTLSILSRRTSVYEDTLKNDRYYVAKFEFNSSSIA